MTEPGAAQGQLVADVAELCRRLLGSPAVAREAAVAALTAGPDDRVEMLARAVRECRRRTATWPPVGAASDGRSLEEAVAAEVAAASGSLPDRQREALVLRERLRLSHTETGQVMGLDAAAAGLLLARARLLLRARLRGTEPEEGRGCADWERCLRALARRQDAETLEPGEAELVREHLMGCPDCERAHAAMLEASVCYRAWDHA